MNALSAQTAALHMGSINADSIGCAAHDQETYAFLREQKSILRTLGSKKLYKAVYV